MFTNPTHYSQPRRVEAFTLEKATMASSAVGGDLAIRLAGTSSVALARGIPKWG